LGRKKYDLITSGTGARQGHGGGEYLPSYASIAKDFPAFPKELEGSPWQSLGKGPKVRKVPKNYVYEDCTALSAGSGFLALNSTRSIVSLSDQNSVLQQTHGIDSRRISGAISSKIDEHNEEVEKRKGEGENGVNGRSVDSAPNLKQARNANEKKRDARGYATEGGLCSCGTNPLTNANEFICDEMFPTYLDLVFRGPEWKTPGHYKPPTNGNAFLDRRLVELTRHSWSRSHSRFSG